MKRILLVVAVLSWSSPAWAAAIASNGTGGGNWSATATWAGGVVPVAGTDTVSIAAGDTVTADSAAMSGGQLLVGSDPGTGGTAAISIGTAAQATATRLIVAAGVVVRLRGDLTITGQNASGGAFSTLQMNSGSTLIFDPPSAGKYLWNLWYCASIVTAGTTNTGSWPDTAGGNHVTIKTDLARGGTNCYTTIGGAIPASGTAGTAVFGGLTSCTFADFANFGTTAAYGLYVFTRCSILGYTTYPLSVSYCTFTGCSYIILSEDSTLWTGNYTWDHNIHTSSILTNQFTSQASGAWFNTKNSTSLTNQSVTNSSFDSLVVLDFNQSLILSGNYFGGSLYWISHANPQAWPNNDMYFNNNVVVLTAAMGTVSMGSLRDCYFLVNSGSAIGVTSPVASAVVTGCVFEQYSGNGLLGCGMIDAAGNGVTASRCLVLPAPGDGKGVGSLIWCNNKTGLIAEHNLAFGPTTYGTCMAAARPGSGIAGQVASARSNIVYSAATGSFVTAVMEYNGTSFTNDVVTVAGNNCFTNATAGPVKYNAGATGPVNVTGYYNLEITNASAPPNAQLGSGDLVANPTFASIATYGAGVYGTSGLWNQKINGGTATAAAATAAIAANPGLIQGPNGLIRWVRSQYVPTNITLKGATYAGDSLTTDANGNPMNGTIGPMGYPSAATAGGGAALLPSADRRAPPTAPVVIRLRPVDRTDHTRRKAG